MRKPELLLLMASSRWSLLKTRLSEWKLIRVGVNEYLVAVAEHMIPLSRRRTPGEGAGAVYLLCLPESN